jgi:hypothetical protein
MNPQETLAREARIRVRMAIVAGVAAALFVAAAAAQLAGPQSKVSELTLTLIVIHKRGPLEVFGAVFQALALVTLASVLWFLFDVAKARRPELHPSLRYLPVAGAAISAIGGIAYATLLVVKASDFVNHGAQTYQQANHLTSGALLPVLSTLNIAMQFVIELGLIVIILNAMRVGILTKFLGYFGFVVGAAGMLLIGSPPAALLQIFWLVALAYLFSGRWPAGDPPAWQTGKAEPWPSGAELRAQRVAGGGGGGGGGRIKPAPQPAAETVGASAPARSRAGTSKRKRKRRR